MNEEWNVDNEWGEEEKTTEVEEKTTEVKNKRRSGACITRSEKTIYRRAFSETQDGK